MPGLRAIWNPALYHGHHKQKRFFEGWYYKFATASGTQRYAIIPGIFLHDDSSESHAFIQTLDGVTGETTYQRFAVKDFHAAQTEFDLRIGDNHFRVDCLSLNIDSPELRIQGELNFDALQPWPIKPLSPGIMSWYTFVPFMECYHGVLSLDHSVRGNLQVNDEAINFDGGRGYIEKDWGKAFPDAYIWMQTNHFESPETSLTASVAMIPWLGRSFRGEIVGFWHGGELYRFAKYTGAKTTRLTLTDSHVHWQLTGKTGSGDKRATYRLEIDAERSEGGLLLAPYREAMLERIVESLTAVIDVRLIRLDGAQETIVFSETGRYGGLEVAGDLDRLVDENQTEGR